MIPNFVMATSRRKNLNKNSKLFDVTVRLKYDDTHSDQKFSES